MRFLAVEPTNSGSVKKSIFFFLHSSLKAIYHVLCISLLHGTMGGRLGLECDEMYEYLRFLEVELIIVRMLRKYIS